MLLGGFLDGGCFDRCGEGEQQLLRRERGADLCDERGHLDTPEDDVAVLAALVLPAALHALHAQPHVAAAVKRKAGVKGELDHFGALAFLQAVLVVLRSPEQADVIVCDYNYIFDPYVGLKAYQQENDYGDCVLVVDEAHNLVDRMQTRALPDGWAANLPTFDADPKGRSHAVSPARAWARRRRPSR